MDGVCSRDSTPVDAPTAPTAPQDTLTVEEIAEGAPPAGTAERAAAATLTNPGGNSDDAGAAALLDSPVGQKLSELRDEIVLIHQLRGELLVLPLGHLGRSGQILLVHSDHGRLDILNSK